MSINILTKSRCRVNFKHLYLNINISNLAVTIYDHDLRILADSMRESLVFSNPSDLENDGLALCKPSADRRNTVPAAPSPELVSKGHGNPAGACPDRMAERDGPAVHVCFIPERLPLFFVSVRQDLR